MGAGASRECFSDRILVHDEPLSEHNLSDPQALLLQLVDPPRHQRAFVA
jgi:hypothetical protein